MVDIERTIDDLKFMNELCHGTVLDDAIAILAEQPQIVRCRDCIWFHKPDEGTGKPCKCNYHGCKTKEDRYCWWGEKDA